MKIVFIGAGYVGLITSLVLATKNKLDDFCVIDCDLDKIKNLKNGRSHFYEPGLDELLISTNNIEFGCNYNGVVDDADIIFICVGTPINKDGNWNLSYLYSSIDEIFKYNKKCELVIKSTVPIGTCKKIKQYIFEKFNVRINVINNPEFLSQGSAINDTLFPNRIIIGNDTNEKPLTSKLYSSFKNILYMATDASEMSKIAANNFLATKLSFFNEISNICRINNISVNDVIESMKYDDRIGNKYMTPGVGYGGSCLPKDTKSLCQWSKENGYDSKLISAAIEVNESQRLILIDLMKKNALKKINKISILGLTFKEDTDDIRDSSSIETIHKLLDCNSNYSIKVYDPKGMENTKKIFLNKIEYANSLLDCITGADAILIFTKWQEFFDLNDFDLDEILTKDSLIVDGQNIITRKTTSVKVVRLNY